VKRLPKKLRKSFQAKWFYLLLVAALVTIVVWVGAIFWTRWKITALIMGIIFGVLGCKHLPDNNGPVYHGP
jgi:hypothetical protein